MTSENNISAEFPYKSKFIEVGGSRLHYVEEGEDDPILFLHGNPTSSYLWRNVMPHLSGQGRCIALDLIGMGKSDKPDIGYRFFDHARYVEGFIDALGLENITFITHDWGSALGFHYATRNQAHVKGLAYMEAILMPVPDWNDFPMDMADVFKGFRTPEVGWEMIGHNNMFIEQVLPGATMRELSEAEMTRYREPYLELESRRPLWQWTNEIPIEGEPADVTEAVNAYLQKLMDWDIPKLHIHASPGAINPPPMIEWAKENLKNLTTVDIGAGIHFIQEDHPHEIGKELAGWHADL